MTHALKQNNFFLYVFLIVLFIYIGKIPFAFSDDKNSKEAQEYKLGQEQIVIGVRKNMVWTDLNVKYLLTDILLTPNALK